MQQVSPYIISGGFLNEEMLQGRIASFVASLSDPLVPPEYEEKEKKLSGLFAEANSSNC